MTNLSVALTTLTEISAITSAKRLRLQSLTALARIIPISAWRLQSVPYCPEPSEYAFAALNLAPDGTPLTYKKAMLGPNAVKWFNAEGEEICRLVDSGTVRAIQPRNQPVDRRGDTTYYNPQPKEKAAAD